MDLDPVMLARLQFAFTIIFHIIFPSFTIGLSAYIATLGALWLRTDIERYHLLMRFWTKIFALSFAMGVVSGIVMSYQFGTNWSRFSIVVGNVVGPLIGYEVLTAFFLEATFLGVLLFGFNKVPPWLYVMSAIIVAVGTAMSAFWILAAGSWMHTPAGYEIRNGVVFPTDWVAAIFNPSFLWPAVAHMLNAAWPDDRLRGAGGWRALSDGRQTWSRKPAPCWRMADSGLTVIPGAAALDQWRPARAQHAEIPADQGRRDGGALGQQRSRRFPHLCLARRCCGP